jgi:predicted aspartyl protease
MRTLGTAFIGLLAVALQSTAVAHAAAPEAAAAADVDIPMDVSTGRPQIEARFKGRTISVTYDTGAQGATIPRSLAQQLELPVIGRALVGSPNGGTPVEVDVVSIDGLEIGGLRLVPGYRTLDALIIDDARLPPGTAMVIGNNQFPGQLIELDFPAARFRVSQESAEDTKAWAPLNDRGMVETRLRIGGDSVPAHIDTGNPGVLDLPETLATRLPLTNAREGTRITFVDGSVKTTEAEMQADALLGDLPVRLDGTFRFAPIPFANLGGNGLKGALLRIDMQGKRWLLRYAGAAVPVIGTK